MRQIRFSRRQQSVSAPAFWLASSRGEQVSLHGFRGRSNLLMAFANGASAATWERALKGLAEHRSSYEAEKARVLAVMRAGVQEVQQVSQRLDSSTPLLLADPEGTTIREYMKLLPEEPHCGEVLVLVLDRYGAPQVAFATDEAEDPTLHETILSWLEGIELECPE